MYDTVAKALVETDPFELDVLPEGSLPAAGIAGLCALAAALFGAGLLALRHRKKAVRR